MWILSYGKNYYCYEDGSIIELDKDGWNKVGEEYLYVEDGELLTDCIALIDGSYYAFAENEEPLYKYDKETDEYIYNEDKQYTFEGILYSAMNLYSNGRASRSKVIETHKMLEEEIASKKEEKLGRTQELNSFKTQALNELGYTSINENNAKEVFEKIAEIMSRKF